MENQITEAVEKTEKLTYSVQEAADILGVEHKTVRRAIDRGQIPCIPIGRLKRIPKVPFHRMLDLGGMVDALV